MAFMCTEFEITLFICACALVLLHSVALAYCFFKNYISEIAKIKKLFNILRKCTLAKCT